MKLAAGSQLSAQEKHNKNGNLISSKERRFLTDSLKLLPPGEEELRFDGFFPLPRYVCVWTME